MSHKLKKSFLYSRNSLIILLVIYLLIVWMYFKDNVSFISSQHLLIGFVIIPIAFILLISLINWKYKQIEKNESNDDNNKEIIKKDLIIRPNISNLFLKSKVCLPEGYNFQDIVENSKDLTKLDDSIKGIDNLPILTKPISGIETEIEELFFADEDFDSATKRIYLILNHLFLENEADLIKTAAQFVVDPKKSEVDLEQNLTASLHPDWEQKYILSTEINNDDFEDKKIKKKVSHILLYLFIPDYVEKEAIKQFILARMSKLGFENESIKFEVPPTYKHQDLQTPFEILKEHIINISKDSTPKLSLFISIDSEINDEWVDQNYFNSDKLSNSVIPQEMGLLLYLWNNPANSFIEYEESLATSLLSFQNNKYKQKDSSITSIDESNFKFDIRQISNFINQILTSNPNNSDKNDNDKEQQDTDALDDLSELTLNFITDINPTHEPYNLSLIFRVFEPFIDKNAIVNDYHLGQYVNKTSWMNNLVALALFLNFENKNTDKSNKTFLITHDNSETLLWINSTTVTI